VQIYEIILTPQKIFLEIDVIYFNYFERAGSTTNL